MIKNLESEACERINVCPFSKNETLRKKFCYKEKGSYCPEKFDSAVQEIIEEDIPPLAQTREMYE